MDNLGRFKNKIIRFGLMLLALSFVFVFFGAASPGKDIDFENLVELQEALEGDYYYFGLDSWRTTRVAGYYKRRDTKLGCSTKGVYDIEKGYLTDYRNENRYFQILAYSNGSLYYSHLGDDVITKSMETSLGVIEYVYDYPYISTSAIYSLSLIKIDGIGYNVYFHWIIDQGITSEDKEKERIAMRAEIDDGLYERIFSSAFKKDGTKLVG